MTAAELGSAGKDILAVQATLLKVRSAMPSQRVSKGWVAWEKEDGAEKAEDMRKKARGKRRKSQGEETVASRNGWLAAIQIRATSVFFESNRGKKFPENLCQQALAAHIF